MKKFLSTIIVFVMIFSYYSVTFASDENIIEVMPNNNENGATDDIHNEPLELSLENAIKYAVENDRDLYVKELSIKNSQIIYEQQNSKIKEYEELPDFIKSEMPVIDRRLMKNGYNKRSIDIALRIAEWNKLVKENEIKYNVEKGYYDLLQIEKELEIAKESLDLATKQYEQSKKMYELGTISSQQLLSIELAVSQTQSGYDAAEMGYELQKMNFNNTLGLPLNQQVILLDRIEYKEHGQVELNNSIKDALDNNGSLKAIKENYELSKLMLEAIEVKYPENTYKYREQQIAVEQAAKNLESAKTGIEMAVRSAYLNLITSEKQIKTYELAVEKAQKALELAQISFELGQNTANDVTQARIELMDAKKNLSKQIHAYNMALLDFKYSTGLGKTPIVGGY